MLFIAISHKVIFSAICIVVVSLLTRKPSDEILEDFEAVKTGKGLAEEG
jgi:hypothetical protein